MFTVETAGNSAAEVHYDGSEDTALFVAVKRTTMKGEDHIVNDPEGTTAWYVEADTKADDESPTFPAIVHDRRAETVDEP